jgi:hypothetical protein
MTTFNRTMIAGECLPFIVDTSQRVVSEWQPSSLYVASTVLRPTDVNETGFWYQNTAEGQSGPIEPSWSTPAGSVTQDGSLTWTALVPPASGEDTISSVAWVQLNPPDGALSISGETNDALTASAYLGGGSSGKVYTVNAVVTMASGAIYIAQIILTVQ